MGCSEPSSEIIALIPYAEAWTKMGSLAGSLADVC